MNSIFSRRQMLQTLSSGFGYLAFSSMASAAAARVRDDKPANPLAPKDPHFAAKAKRVIFLCMRGGPSHLDTFDYKPELIKNHGKTGSFRGSLLKSPWDFKQHGESGLWISELLPKIGSMADELCLLRGMNTDLPVHPRAMTQLHTGATQFVRPSLGSWALYGLGTENESMPGFVSVNTPAGASQNIGNSFLPSVFGGTKIGGVGGRRQSRNRRRGGSQDAVPDIKNSGFTKKQQRAQLDFIQRLNSEKMQRDQHQPGVEGVIESYELAFRMQSAMPDLMDIAGEDQATLDLYGINDNATSSFGRQCLLARRMSESGVRFVEISHNGWDTHFSMDSKIPQLCEQIDKPIAGLLTDLKQRGLLEDTLVIWAGEFGRTPWVNPLGGRDHWPHGFSIAMAGGGIKGGRVIGETSADPKRDSKKPTQSLADSHPIEDVHATILDAMGIDFKRELDTPVGRPLKICEGKPIVDLFSG